VTRRVIRVAKNLLCQEMIGFQHKTYFDSFSNEGDPMTQMMLFDAPANTATVPVPDFVGRDSNPRGVSWERSSEKRFCGSRSVHAKKASCEAIGVSGEAGVQRMGDLARLVLLRYDLMAKRRARYASRRCAR